MQGGTTYPFRSRCDVDSPLVIQAGSGDDSVDTTGTTVGGAKKVDADGGTNTVVP